MYKIEQNKHIITSQSYSNSIRMEEIIDLYFDLKNCLPSYLKKLFLLYLQGYLFHLVFHLYLQNPRNIKRINKILVQ